MNAVIRLARRCCLAALCACLLLPWSDANRLRGDGPALMPVLEGPLLPPPPAPSCLPKEWAPPVLKIKVSVPAESAPGQEVRYCFCVENCSTTEAHHVVVKNALPANARFVRADPAPSAREPELQWQLGTIGGGATREIVLVLQPTNREDIKNCARVSFEHGVCVVTRQAALPSAEPPEVMPLPREVPPAVPPPPPAPGAKAKPPVVKEVPPVVDADGAQLQLTIEGHKQQYVNLPSRYFFTLTNTGKARATSILLMARLPAQAKFAAASDRGQHVEGQVAWVLGSLDPGAKRTVSLDLRAGEPGEWCVKAEALADKNIRTQGEFCTAFVGVSALSVDLTDREDPIIVGGRTTYVIPIGNPGSAAVTRLLLRARIPAGLQVVRTQPPEHIKGKADATGQWLEFTPLPELGAGKQVTYEVTVEGMRVGAQRFHIELSADQLEMGPIVEDENTTVFEDDVELRKSVPPE